MNSGLCATCKHWNQEVLTTAYRDALELGLWTTAGQEELSYKRRQQIQRRLSRRFGRCEAVGHGWDLDPDTAPNTKAVCWDASEYIANLNTRDDFGCVLHEPMGDGAA